MSFPQTFIEFPCDFQLKIMGKSTATFHSEIATIINQHISAEDILSLRHRLSKQGRYIAISVIVFVREKIILDDLYRNLTQHPDVKMVL